MTDPVCPVTPREELLARIEALEAENERLVNKVIEQQLAAAPVPCAASPADPDLLGLSIDMLDADRLRIWAEKIETHGADISHWSSPAFVVKELRRVADGIAAAVKDIGTLRATGEGARDEGEVGVQRVVDVLTAAPVAVSLDPHRLFDALLAFVDEHVKAGRSTGRDDEFYRGWDAAFHNVRNKILELARLRGEATVRVEE